jgi:hypothetical protein
MMCVPRPRSKNPGRISQTRTQLGNHHRTPHPLPLPGLSRAALSFWTLRLGGKRQTIDLASAAAGRDKSARLCPPILPYWRGVCVSATCCVSRPCASLLHVSKCMQPQSIISINSAAQQSLEAEQAKGDQDQRYRTATHASPGWQRGVLLREEQNKEGCRPGFNHGLVSLISARLSPSSRGG